MQELTSLSYELPSLSVSLIYPTLYHSPATDDWAWSELLLVHVFNPEAGLGSAGLRLSQSRYPSWIFDIGAAEAMSLARGTRFEGDDLISGFLQAAGLTA